MITKMLIVITKGRAKIISRLLSILEEIEDELEKEVDDI